MSREKWKRRKPGSISGTIVPPPADDSPTAAAPPDGSPLPKRTPGGHWADPLPRQRRPEGSPAGHRAEDLRRNAPPQEPVRLPDNVRSLFKPVIVTPEAGERVVRPRGAKPAARSPGNRPGLVVAAPDRGAAESDAGSGRASGVGVGKGAAAGVGKGAAAGVGKGEAAGVGKGETAGVGKGSGVSAETGSAASAGKGSGVSAGKDSRESALARHGSPARRRRVVKSAAGGRHGLWLAALTVLVVLTAAGTTLALVQQSAPETRLVSSNPQAGLSYAAAIRARAAAWITREVTRGAIIACDAVMCADLHQAGEPWSSLHQISPTAPDPFGTDVIVATPVLRSVFGSRLESEYAPAILASFGHAPSQVQVRVVAAYGAAAYMVALSRDLAARKTVGVQLAGNNRIAMPSGARAQLLSGLVDPRLLLMLPALAAEHPIQVLTFYDVAPGAGPDVPLTGVELSGTDGKADLSARAYSSWLISFARTQIDQFKASSVTTAQKNGRPIVSVRFSRPTPLGLIRSLGN